MKKELKYIEDWSNEALWIGGNNLVRTDFSLAKSAKSASLRISGLGYFELYVNGIKIGDQVLAPVQTDYDCRIFYLTLDVAAQLRAGSNTIGVMLGEGFFSQSAVCGRHGWAEESYGEKRLRMQLDITCTDNKKHRIVSDGRWITASGPVVSDNVYAGEVYDARKEIPGWAEPIGEDFSGYRRSSFGTPPTWRHEFNVVQARRLYHTFLFNRAGRLPAIPNTNPHMSEAWSPVTLLPPPGGVMLEQEPEIESCKIIRLIRPVAVTYPDPDTAVFDLGENIAGWARIQVNEPRGTRLELRFAEEVDENGRLDPSSTGVFATHCVQTDVYICRGDTGGETWEPRFTYHGFRFVSLTGWTHRPELENLTGAVVHTAVATDGEFHSDHQFLNTVYQMSRRTLLGNLHGIPSDCPARERCGWLGDAQVMAEFAICNFDMEKFWRKYMDDIATSTLNGIPTMIAPGRRRCGEATPAWGSTVVQLPWYLHLYYGDTVTLDKHYPLMQRWVTHLESKATDGIVSYGLGDWCPPGTVRPTETPVALTSTAYYYYDAWLLSRIATIIGNHEDTAKYAALAISIKSAFQQRFYQPEHHSFGSQTADAFALFLGLVPDGNEQATADALSRDILEKHNGHFSTGITGLKYLFGELCRYGYEDLAVDTICRPGYPGFSDLIQQGATTLWETWEKNPADEPTPRSRNHPMQTGFAVWFHQILCGIRPDPAMPAFQHVIIAPCFPAALGYASAWQNTQFGRISCSWQRQKDGLEVKIQIPNGCQGTFQPPVKWQAVPSGDRPLPAGEHILRVNPFEQTNRRMTKYNSPYGIDY
jgi:alpha-L-rhamnosidase